MDRPQSQLERLLIEHLNKLSDQHGTQMQQLAAQQEQQSKLLSELSQRVDQLIALLAD